MDDLRREHGLGRERGRARVGLGLASGLGGDVRALGVGELRRGAVGPGVASTATNRVTLANWSRRQPNSFAARAAASSTRARFSGGAASPFASPSADRADDAAADPNANGYDSSLFAKKPRTTYSVSPGPSQK